MKHESEVKWKVVELLGSDDCDWRHKIQLGTLLTVHPCECTQLGPFPLKTTVMGLRAPSASWSV